MSTATGVVGPGRGGRTLLALRAGLCLVCVGAVALGVSRSAAMALGGRGHGDMAGRLMGMPLSAMPEMVVAFVALLGVVTTVALAPRRSAPDGRLLARAASTRWRSAQLAACAVALSIDVSKTSSLGFVIPGMRAEYGLAPSRAAMLAVLGLTGTLLGATLMRTVGQRWAHQDVYLVGALGFTVTSSCGMMPSFAGNQVMCLLMGVSVGGLAPLLVGLLRDLGPAGRRSGVVVGLALVSSAVGFLVASGAAAWLEPRWGWRAIWLVGAPTGIVLLLATPLFAVAPIDVRPTRPTTAPAARIVPLGWQYAFATLAGVVAFGVSTWTPTLASRGVEPAHANLVLVGVSVALVPTAVLLGWVYHRFGPGALNAGLATTLAVALAGLLGAQLPGTPTWLPAAALAGTLFAVNAMSAVLMPVAADSAGSAVRTRTTSTISIFNRAGGLAGPLVLALLITSTPRVLAAVAAMSLVCGLAGFGFGRFGRRQGR